MSKFKIWSDQSMAGPTRVKVGKEAEAFVVHVDQETGNPVEPCVHVCDVPVEFNLAKGQGEMLISDEMTGPDGSAFAIYTPETAGDFLIVCYVGAKPATGKIDDRTRLQYKGTADDGKRKRVDTLRPFASAVPAPPPSEEAFQPRANEHRPITSLPPEQVAAVLAKPAAQPRPRPNPEPARQPTQQPKAKTGVAAPPRPVPTPVAKTPAEVRPATDDPKRAPRRPVQTRTAPTATPTVSVPPPAELTGVITITSLLADKRPSPQTFCMTSVMSKDKERATQSAAQDGSAQPTSAVRSPSIAVPTTSRRCEADHTESTVPSSLMTEPSPRFKRIAICALALGVVAFITLFIWDSTKPVSHDSSHATPATVQP